MIEHFSQLRFMRFACYQQKAHHKNEEAIIMSLRQFCRLGTRMICLSFFITFLSLCFPPFSSSENETIFSSFVQKYTDGRIDWQENVIYGIGRGYLHANGGSKARALGAARVVASGSIVKIAASMNLDEQQSLKSLGNGRVIIQLKAYLRIKEIETRFVEDAERSYVEVTQTSSISGIEGLTSKLLSHLKSNPVGWDEFPNPPSVSTLNDQDQPWLVLDARKLAAKDTMAQPALFPKIIGSDGEVVYELKKVNEIALYERGMASYVISNEPKERFLSDAKTAIGIFEKIDNLLSASNAFAQDEKKKIKKGKYIVTEVERAEGLKNTNLIINEKDASQLVSEDKKNDILKNCRVIVIVSGSIGGVESKLPNSFKLAQKL